MVLGNLKHLWLMSTFHIAKTFSHINLIQLLRCGNDYILSCTGFCTSYIFHSVKCCIPCPFLKLFCTFTFSKIFIYNKYKSSSLTINKKRFRFVIDKFSNLDAFRISWNSRHFISLITITVNDI